jgi:putative addiction module CopG family antidote
VEERVKSGRYANASDYVRDLIRRDQEMREALVQALIKGESAAASASARCFRLLRPGPSSKMATGLSLPEEAGSRPDGNL